MKKFIVASMALGIVAGVLALDFMWLVSTGALFIGQNYVNTLNAQGIFLFPSLYTGVLGIAGGIIVKFRRPAGGILMIIAACLAMPNLVSMAMLIVAAVFALKQYEPESASQAVMPPPLPQDEWERGNPATKV
ncbi:hypothetical protein SDC9_103194 [bioreactor metagenome]|uniref:DUF4064 domain-containing protein n=1 Tax=bioreactor metagenome TaxID=1076179 RepID=A0A645ASZ8_9ZZZZ